jgi:hypothetical protein
MRMFRSIQKPMPRLVAELHAEPALRSFSEGGFAESAKLEHLSSVALAKDEAIKANLRGLGYGG